MRGFTISLPACLISMFFLSSAPTPAYDLVLTVEPEVGTLDQAFTITITNLGKDGFPYDPCCSFPRIHPVADYNQVFCSGCTDPCLDPGVSVLASGSSLDYVWRPLESACIGNRPAPGLHEVRWKGFNDWPSARVELLPQPSRTVDLSAKPREARFGDRVEIVVRNTSASSLCVEPGRLPLSILDSRGIQVLGGAGPLCGPARCCDIIAQGESRAYPWTPEESPREGVRSLPGRYRITWSALGEDGDHYHGATTVLVLPSFERRVELALSQTEARPGDLLRITATNPQDESVWHDWCCNEPVILDELGQEARCISCPTCPFMRSEEIPPGGSLAMEKTIPEPGECGLSPGRWSVILDRGMAMTPGGMVAPPVFGYAEVTVVAGGDRAFRRGDCDGNQGEDLTDAVSLLQHLFLGSGAPACLDACDTDDSGALDLSDSIWILSFLFLGGPSPLPPFPGPGLDPTPDALGCGR